jgi:hypothetical protein
LRRRSDHFAVLSCFCPFYATERLCPYRARPCIHHRRRRHLPSRCAHPLNVICCNTALIYQNGVPTRASRGAEPACRAGKLALEYVHVARSRLSRLSRALTDRIAVEILVERRRLGQTQLNIKIPNVSAKGVDKGTFDYAHLRVPLPKDLSGSEIFALKNTASYPESYFLMV